MIKKIVMILAMSFIVSTAHAGGKMAEDLRESTEQRLESIFNSRLYANLDRVLKWDNNINIKTINIPGELDSVFDTYIKHYNWVLKHRDVVIHRSDDSDSDIVLIYAKDIEKIWKDERIKKYYDVQADSEEDIKEELKKYLNEGLHFAYELKGDRAQLILLWNPEKLPVKVIVDENERFQMLKVLYVALAFTPATTRTKDLIFTGDKIYRLSPRDKAFLTSLYDNRIERLDPIDQIEDILVDNIVSYLLAVINSRK